MAEPSEKQPHIIGGFEIVSKLGQGAMGAVFKAKQVSLDRMIALKILPPISAKNKSLIDNFRREARVSAMLGHPNVIQGVDVGQDEATGLWYFAMEYVDGPPLRKLIQKKGPLPESQALSITRQIAEALVCAEKHNIVHRDIKPDNILLSSTGEAKLADLGLARPTSDETAAESQTGNAVGTPHYMAPEQVRGQIGQIDTRTDIYALGATLFHLLTGQPPFEGDSGAVVMAKQLNSPVPLAHRVNRNAGEASSRLIVHMMQKDKEKRVSTPAELIELIDNISQNVKERRSSKGRETQGVRRRSMRESRGNKRISGRSSIGKVRKDRRSSSGSSHNRNTSTRSPASRSGPQTSGPLPAHKSPIVPMVLILLVLFLGAVGYLVFNKSKKPPKDENPIEKTAPKKKSTKKRSRK